MPRILKQKWLWVIILSFCLIIIAPLFVVWMILQLSPTLRFLATVLIVVGWGVVAGYKEWITERAAQKR